MYELRIAPYKDFEKSIDYIHSMYLPREGETIEKYLILTDDPNDDAKTIKYYWTLQVQKVHFELFKDKSLIPVVYANVISEEVVE